MLWGSFAALAGYRCLGFQTSSETRAQGFEDSGSGLAVVLVWQWKGGWFKPAAHFIFRNLNLIKPLSLKLQIMLNRLKPLLK